MKKSRYKAFLPDRNLQFSDTNQLFCGLFPFYTELTEKQKANAFRNIKERKIMKIRTAEEAKRLEEVIKKCRRTVYLTTVDGDQYDLKSLFGWYLGIIEMMNGAYDNSEMKIVAKSNEDQALISSFISQRQMAQAA